MAAAPDGDRTMTPVDHDLAGQRDAEALLVALRGSCTDGDELSAYLTRKLHAEQHGWLRGFCRQLQKEIERGRA
jgi:hypothetical protein